MTADEIRSYRNAKPFQPFTLLLQSGRLVHVELPVRIAIDPKGRSVAVFEGPDFHLVRIDEVRSAAAEEPARK